MRSFAKHGLHHLVVAACRRRCRAALEATAEAQLRSIILAATGAQRTLAREEGWRSVPMSRNWPRGLYQLLKDQGVRQVSVVPDAGHMELIQLCESDPGIELVRLTTEEEGVALAMGAWLGGDKSVLLTQSSGVGNCINMLSMLAVSQTPLAMLVTMRGDWGEFNPWQVPMGRASQPVLEAMGVLVSRADRPEDVVPLAEGALRLAYNTLRPTALLIGQQLLGAKTFKD
jgi:sulfopyruvate decarboxylase alpha subunit